MPESNENLYAPWRMQYLESLRDRPARGGCFLCDYMANPQADAANFVLARSAQAIVLLNRYPYTNGHLLVAPVEHVPRLSDLRPAVLHELAERLANCQRVLAELLHAEGFNIGMNLGHCAGAGLPDHVHWHIVPRWGGDTNFLAVVGGVRLQPQTLESVYAGFLATAARLGL